MNTYYLLSLLSAILFGASTPASKALLGQLPPLLLAGIYYLGAALFLLPLSIKEFPREVRHLRHHKNDIKRLLGAVFFGGILGPVLFLIGITKMSASSASLLLNLESVATFFLGILFFKEHITKKVSYASLLILLAGIILVIEKDFSFNIGGLFVAGACLCWGLDNNYTASVEGISARTNTLIKGLIASIVNISLFFFFYSSTSPSLSYVTIALLIGAFSYGLSIVLYIYAARNVGAIRSQLIFSTSPFMGSLLSFLFLAERPGIKFFLASAFMILAIFFLHREKHEHSHHHQETEHEHEHSHHDGHHHHHHPSSSSKTHTHKHRHEALVHMHDHHPDVHHRHTHK